jgi:hypothetical protein
MTSDRTSKTLCLIFLWIESITAAESAFRACERDSQFDGSKSRRRTVEVSVVHHTVSFSL